MFQKPYPKPNLNQFKLQAKELRKAHQKGEVDACFWIKKLLPRLANVSKEEILTEKITHSESQFIIARGYGFDSWPKLKKYVESIETDLDTAIFAFLNASVPEVNVNHRSGTLDKANEILTKIPDIASVNIYAACVLGKHNIIRKMLNQNPGLTNEKGGPRNWQPLMYLCFSRFLRFESQRTDDFVKAARLLIEQGADPNIFFMSGDEKETPIYGAAGVANNPGIMKVLLESGADANDPDAYYHVAEFDNFECFKLFFDYGVKEEGRATMLTRKLDFDEIESVRYLLKLGCDPNEMGIWNKTALHQAIMRGRDIEFVDLLIEFGADVNACIVDGKSAFALAAQLGRTDVMDVLLKNGAKNDLSLNDLFIAACARADEKEIHSLLNQHTNLVALLTHEDKVTMIEAAKQGHAKAVAMMLDAGFPVGLKDSGGATALHWAAWYGFFETTKTLLRHKAPLDIEDPEHGKDPLGWAVHGSIYCDNSNGNYVEVVRSLVDAGAIIQKFMVREASEEVSGVLVGLT